MYPRLFQPSSPLRGRFLAVEWRTPNEGTHLLLAKTRESLLKNWDVVVRQEYESRMVAAGWEMTFLDPPEDVAVKLDEEVFWDLAAPVQFMIAEAAHDLKAMPPEFRSCDLLHERRDREVKFFDHRYVCDVCASGILWRDVEPTQDAQKQAWLSVLQKPEMLPLLQQGQQDRKRRPDPSDQPVVTHTILAEFGHHARGLMIHEGIPDIGSRSWRGYVSFVSAKKLPMPEVSQRLAAEARRAKEEERERGRQQAAQIAEMRRRENAQGEQAFSRCLFALRCGEGPGAPYADIAAPTFAKISDLRDHLSRCPAGDPATAAGLMKLFGPQPSIENLPSDLRAQALRYLQDFPDIPAGFWLDVFWDQTTEGSSEALEVLLGRDWRAALRLLPYAAAGKHISRQLDRIGEVGELEAALRPMIKRCGQDMRRLICRWLAALDASRALLLAFLAARVDSEDAAAEAQLPRDHTPSNVSERT